MKKIITLLCIANACLAQIPIGYYNSAANLSGNNLKIALHNIIKNHTQISYSGLWTAYKKTDKKPNGKVWDMYSDIPSGTPPYQFTFTTDQCGSYAVEGDCYNREHSWPQSWFNSLTGPVSDMFHVYPTDGKVNGIRSNYPYGNVSAPTVTTQNGSKLGACTNLGYSLTVFEPIDEYKGDFARGYFYMSTRYYSEDAGWATSDATNKSNILPWQLSVLLQWNQQDPVSAKEIARNDSVYYKYQNNRNPFIDNPQWADSIWATSVVSFVNENQFKHSFSICPNPTVTEFTVITHTNEIQNYTIRITDVTGKLIEEKLIPFIEMVTINCAEWQHGLYFVSISNGNAISNFKVLKL